MEILALIVIAVVTGSTVSFCTWIRERHRSQAAIAQQQCLMRMDANFVELRKAELAHETKLLGGGQ